MFIVMYCCCDRAGQLGDEHSEGKGGEKAVTILRFLGGSPRLYRLMTASFRPRWQVLICTDRMSGL
jgi:hypothetical protein